MNSVKPPDEKSQENTHQLNLNEMTVPKFLCHIKVGNTLYSNDHILLLQDGSTTIEFRLPPQFQPKRIPWRFGLIRDIAWSSRLDIFILLTRDGLFSISPKSMFIPETAINRPLEDFTINTYSKIKPYHHKIGFWRCACVARTLYILYSGLGTIIEEYTLGVSSCRFVNRWLAPQTCAIHEGIWCIRHHPETDQLGLTIMDSRTNQWRIEIRSREKLTLLWQLPLPLLLGDAELSPLSNGEWLAVNSCGLRLIQIANQQLKAVVEYARELRNTITLGNSYIAIRTKNTLEIHENKLL